MYNLVTSFYSSVVSFKSCLEENVGFIYKLRSQMMMMTDKDKDSVEKKQVLQVHKLRLFNYASL